jgi:hypothetical protein
MTSGLLIDDKGRSWADNSWELARRIGYVDALSDIATHAVRERGFIHIRPGNHARAVHVALRERCFNLIAFTATMLELGRAHPSRIMLSLATDDQPTFRLFMDLHDFCREVEPLAFGRALEIRIPRLAERRTVRVLNLPEFKTVRELIDLWRGTRGELTDDVRRTAFASGLFQRTILVRQTSSMRLITEHLGAGIMILRPCEALLTIGRDFADMPDRDYGAWVAQAYEEVLGSRRLRVDSVRASVRTSATTTLRTRYDRVLMPWRGKGSDMFGMGVSIRRESPTEVS